MPCRQAICRDLEGEDWEEFYEHYKESSDGDGCL